MGLDPDCSATVHPPDYGFSWCGSRWTQACKGLGNGHPALPGEAKAPPPVLLGLTLGSPKH